jgi:hypothetical protein
MFTDLHKVATVSLGYKSLQNDFFYVNKATIDTYGVEKKFLVPMLMLKDLDGASFEQRPSPSLWLFACREKRADLRGTGAFRYIEAMADHSASRKKQTGKNLTIMEALEAQSGGTWYAPKARPNSHNIWLRKAFGTVYAPFLFEKAALVDQRLNSLTPVAGIEWKSLAAALTSTLFAYSLEINGAASMGAGALEAPTTKLRDYPVLNVAELNAAQTKKLVALGEAVWSTEKPVDWGLDGSTPGPHLRALDEWILKTASGTSLKRLRRLRSACRSRLPSPRTRRKNEKAARRQHWQRR